MTSITDLVAERLNAALPVTHLAITDTTWQHSGHSGNNGGAHLSIVIVSPRFEGLGVLDRHRLIQSTLSQEMASNLIHAMELKTLTPDAWQSN
jgi:BolA family transcriptional regulator, general stress-responsive regulator